MGRGGGSWLEDADRQVSSNALVGVSPANRPVIDRMFKLVMGAFKKSGQ